MFTRQAYSVGLYFLRLRPSVDEALRGLWGHETQGRQCRCRKPASVLVGTVALGRHPYPPASLPHDRWGPRQSPILSAGCIWMSVWGSCRTIPGLFEITLYVGLRLKRIELTVQRAQVTTSYVTGDGWFSLICVWISPAIGSLDCFLMDVSGGWQV